MLAVRLAARDVLLWLLAAGFVAVFGGVLLEGARLTAPASPGGAAGVLLPMEFALYLLVLRETRGPRLTGGGLALGLALALLLRMALSFGLSLVRFSPLAPAGVGSQFLLYYLRLWPVALNQICAVAIFFWLVRDNLVLEPAPALGSRWSQGGDREPGADSRHDLLSALMDREPKEVAQELPKAAAPGRPEAAAREPLPAFLRFEPAPVDPLPPRAAAAAPRPAPVPPLPPPEAAPWSLPAPEMEAPPALAPPPEGEPLLADDPRLAEPILLVEAPEALFEETEDLEETATFPLIQGSWTEPAEASTEPDLTDEEN